MSSRKLGWSILVAVIGAMVLAVSAQAVTPEFLIKEKAVGALKATFSATQMGASSLLVSTYNITFTCKKMTVQEGVIESSTDAKIKILHEECSILTFTKGEELPCQVYVSEANPAPHILSTALLLPAELTNGEPALLGEKVVSLVLVKGPECPMPPIPADGSISGELCLKIDNNAVEPLVLGSASIQSECKVRPVLESLSQGSGSIKDQLKYAAGTGVLDTTSHIFLTGEHKGIPLGVSSEKLPVQPTTQLCKAKEGSCEPYALGTKISANLEKEVKFIFFYEGNKLEPPCRISTMSGKTTEEVKKEGGGPLIGELTALSFEECGGGLCTVAPQGLPYRFEIKATSEGNGTMTWSNGGGGSPRFAIECLGMTKCIYGASSMVLNITAGSAPKLSNSGVALKREAGSGEACGESGAKWEGIAAVAGKVLYEITAPSPLFVRVI
jgi:hypothetical protein